MGSSSTESLEKNTEEMTLWLLEGLILSPTPKYTRRLNRYLTIGVEDDPAFRFIFAPQFKAPEIGIHRSRLVWAGGPLKTLALSEFKEGTSSTVYLSENDHPVAYTVLRDYLYGASVDLSCIKSIEIAILTLRSAHRWDLGVLVHYIGVFIKNQDMLTEAKHIKDYVSDAVLQGDFQYYFWSKVGEFFKEFMKDDSNQDDSSDDSSSRESNSDKQCVPVQLCPKFPQLWTCAVEQDMVEPLVFSILHCVEDVEDKLLHIVLGFLEPRIQDDSAITRMLTMIFDMCPDVFESVICKKSQDVNYSARAMHLLAKSITFPIRSEAKFAWTASLFDAQTNAKSPSFLPVHLSNFGGSECSLEFSLRWNRQKNGVLGDTIYLWWSKRGYPPEAPNVKLMVFDDIWCCDGKNRARAMARAKCLALASWESYQFRGAKGTFRMMLPDDMFEEYMALHSSDCSGPQLRICLQVNDRN